MNIKISSIAILLLAVHLASWQASALKYSICDQDKSISEVKDVLVNECDSLADRCPFNRGLNKSIEIDFVPKRAVEQVKIKVSGKLSAMPIPFQVSPDSACGNYGFDCPLKADQAYKFKLTLPILRSYPKLNVDVFVRLVDEKGQLLSCVEIPAKIQEPPKVES